jgi:hypothetical protein
MSDTNRLLAVLNIAMAVPRSRPGGSDSSAACRASDLAPVTAIRWT